MFTGIVAEVGRVVSVTRKGGGVRFTVAAPGLVRDLSQGDSVAVNGVCQTVADARGSDLCFDSVVETLKRTNLATLRQGSPVNLEPALRLGDRISGHLMSGHVDSTGVVRSRRHVGPGNWDFAVQVPYALTAFVQDKGSIGLDGVSLTVKAVRGSLVEVTVIPYTLEHTIIAGWRVGTLVNVEVDQMAKYLSSGHAKRGGTA